MPNVMLRRFELSDAKALASLGNCPKIALQMSHRFPSPYTVEDAVHFIEKRAAAPDSESFAIEADGHLVGGCGASLGSDEVGRTHLVGYWLGERFWGKGIATVAVSLLVDFIMEHYPRTLRLEARVLGGNDASGRVLEKNGFAREAVLKQRLLRRDGVIVDECIYARFFA